MSKTLDNLDDKTGAKRMDAHLSSPPRISDNGFELMTESEVVQFLRIPEISNSNNHHNVIEHLKRYRDLPRIHICNKALYPRKAVLDWIEKETSK
jgi:hypothetical protein